LQELIFALGQVETGVVIFALTRHDVGRLHKNQSVMRAQSTRSGSKQKGDDPQNQQCENDICPEGRPKYASTSFAFGFRISLHTANLL
jgi:hypothetical protein